MCSTRCFILNLPSTGVATCRGPADGKGSRLGSIQRVLQLGGISEPDLGRIPGEEERGRWLGALGGYRLSSCTSFEAWGNDGVFSTASDFAVIPCKDPELDARTTDR